MWAGFPNDSFVGHFPSHHVARKGILPFVKSVGMFGGVSHGSKIAVGIGEKIRNSVGVLVLLLRCYPSSFSVGRIKYFFYHGLGKYPSQTNGDVFPVPFVFTYIALTAGKVVMEQELGTQGYDARVAQMAQGADTSRIAARLMFRDPVMEYVSARM